MCREASPTATDCFEHDRIPDFLGRDDFQFVKRLQRVVETVKQRWGSRDKLIEAVRPQLERNHRRRWDDRAFRVYYLFGGLLTAALLGAGSLLLVALERKPGPLRATARALRAGVFGVPTMIVEALDEAALKLSIRRNTARTHLRSIFCKTGVTRQTLLVKLLLNSLGEPEDRARYVEAYERITGESFDAWLVRVKPS